MSLYKNLRDENNKRTDVMLEKANSLNKDIDMTKDRTMEKNIDRGSR